CTSRRTGPANAAASVARPPTSGNREGTPSNELLALLDLTEEARHLDGGEGGVPPLVAVAPAGSLEGLRDGVGREHAERHRDARRERRVLDASRGLASDDVEVRRLAAHDGAEAYHRVVSAGLREPPREQRQLERAGYPCQLDRVLGRTVCAEAGERSLDELAHDH